MILAALWIPDVRELVGQVVRLLVAGSDRRCVDTRRGTRGGRGSG